MALKCFIFSRQILNNSNPILSILQKHGMSQYPTYYIKPVYKKEDQDAINKSDKAQKYAHIPTRAAENNQTCSAMHEPDISLFINYIMKSGKKALARELLEKSFEKVKRTQIERYHKANNEDKDKIELNPKVIFHKAVENAKPILQLTPIKRGGVRYQVPVPITEKKSQFLSMKWLIEAANHKDKQRHFPEKLAAELIDASNNTGKAVKRKQDLHIQCEANRAYAHYRWS